jgi:uncharacterized membrane protein
MPVQRIGRCDNSGVYRTVANEKCFGYRTSVGAGEFRIYFARATNGLSAHGADAAAIALLAVVISAAGASRPSFWSDEAATISVSTRSLPELWALLTNVDAVHGLYYLVMHGSFAVFPESEFWSRLPSSLAVGVAAAGVVTHGRQLATRPVAVTAGVVFAILPRVVTHRRRTVARWAAYSVAALVLTAPFAVYTQSQSYQVGWIPDLDARTLCELAVERYFPHVADVIAHHTRPGDCLAFDLDSSWKLVGPLKAARPEAFGKLRNLGRALSATDSDLLWDVHSPISTWSDQLRGCPALWTISERDAPVPHHQRGQALPPGPELGSTPTYRVESSAGFRLVERWQFSVAQVTRSQPEVLPSLIRR